MLMLRSTHERLMAEALARADASHLREEAYWRESMKNILHANQELMESHDRMAAMLADFADRTVPPKRSETVKQPLSIDAADGAVVKKLKGIK